MSATKHLVLPVKKGDQVLNLTVEVKAEHDEIASVYAYTALALLHEVSGNGYAPTWDEKTTRFVRCVKLPTKKELDDNKDPKNNKFELKPMNVADYWEDDWTMTRKILEIIGKERGVL